MLPFIHIHIHIFFFGKHMAEFQFLCYYAYCYHEDSHCCVLRHSCKNFSGMGWGGERQGISGSRITGLTFNPYYILNAKFDKMVSNCFLK